MRCGVNRSVVYDRFWHESESLGAAKNFGGCPGVEETYLVRGTQARVWPNHIFVVAALTNPPGKLSGRLQSHHRHLFEKTGTHRQAELVKLVAGYPTPFSGELHL